MANASAVTGTYMTRTAGLVSVDGRTYPLKSARAEARAEGGVAATTFAQTYDNPYHEPLEVLYTLPLPANGAVIGYTIRLGKRMIRGEVKRRAEAQEAYRKALLDGRTAALLEQERADTFTQKLGCLPPGETAEVEIEVLQPLVFLPAVGEMPARWEYRFPTVPDVRYEGAPGRVPDAANLDVDRAAGEGTPVRLVASLFVADGSAALLHPHAPGQVIDLEDHQGGVRIALRDEMKLDRDLVIRWCATQQEVGVRFVEGRGLPCDDGRYILLTLTPPAAVPKGFSRDLTLLIDASGSMSGRPLDRAKIVAEELLRSLDPGDRFEILAFAGGVERLVPHPVEANDKNIRRALDLLGRLEAGGATEMAQAIIAALAPLRRDSQRQVILLSDGYIGFEGEVIGEVLRRLVPGARLHAVGIGAAPNRTLTRGAARAGRGVEILVGDDDDARAASRRLLQATVRPVLTDLEVKGSALVALAPARPQDVLEGQPQVLLAEISIAGGSLEIQGRLMDHSGSWTRRVEIPGVKEAELTADMIPSALNQTVLPLGALYGREAIEDLELQLAAVKGREAAAFEARIEALGLRHGIASRKTSLIAISEDPTVDPKDPRRRERLAVEVPAEVSAEGVGLLPSIRAAAYAPPAVPRIYRAMPSLGLFEKAFGYGTEDREEKDESHELAPSQQWEDVERYLPEGKGEPALLEIFEARVLRVDGPILIFEFEVPTAGFLLPDDGAMVRVSFGDGTVRDATLVGQESSPPGPHHLGLTVRMALKLEDQYSWLHGEAQLTWTEPGAGEVNLHIMLGP
ncbi:MAG: VWA domain-containing protein [Acidobacteriia bacterium]|nr:VWA domain-containing protein [Terriglobia bacterium]